MPNPYAGRCAAASRERIRKVSGKSGGGGAVYQGGSSFKRYKGGEVQSYHSHSKSYVGTVEGGKPKARADRHYAKGGVIARAIGGEVSGDDHYADGGRRPGPAGMYGGRNRATAKGRGKKKGDVNIVIHTGQRPPTPPLPPVPPLGGLPGAGGPPGGPSGAGGPPPMPPGGGLPPGGGPPGGINPVAAQAALGAIAGGAGPMGGAPGGAPGAPPGLPPKPPGMPPFKRGGKVAHRQAGGQNWPSPKGPNWRDAPTPGPSAPARPFMGMPPSVHEGPPPGGGMAPPDMPPHEYGTPPPYLQLPGPGQRVPPKPYAEESDARRGGKVKHKSRGGEADREPEISEAARRSMGVGKGQKRGGKAYARGGGVQHKQGGGPSWLLEQGAGAPVAASTGTSAAGPGTPARGWGHPGGVSGWGQGAGAGGGNIQPAAGPGGGAGPIPSGRGSNWPGSLQPPGAPLVDAGQAWSPGMPVPGTPGAMSSYQPPNIQGGGMGGGGGGQPSWTSVGPWMKRGGRVKKEAKLESSTRSKSVGSDIGHWRGYASKKNEPSQGTGPSPVNPLKTAVSKRARGGRLTAGAETGVGREEKAASMRRR